MLASERKKLINKEITQRCEYHYPSAYNTYRYSRQLCHISEQIGRNSAKIMRLRTLIQQSKIVWNNHKAFQIRKSISGKSYRKSIYNFGFVWKYFKNIVNQFTNFGFVIFCFFGG